MGSVWEDVRRDFPALDSQAYLNAAAGSPLPRSVREAAESFYRDMEAGGDREWDTWLARVEDTRR
ncbi:MAG TPA: hypothetical protein VIZ31_12120, partial [Vicinamibacteria bacterium]